MLLVVKATSTFIFKPARLKNYRNLSVCITYEKQKFDEERGTYMKSNITILKLAIDRI